MTNQQLSDLAQRLRLHVVTMIGPDTAGHFGGSCSLADIVSVLYFGAMKHDPKNPNWVERDRFLLSKGHAALIQYAALAEAGYFDVAELKTLKRLGSKLQGHPDMLKLPGIEANTGSLGQGLSIACGMAAGLKLQGSGHVYCAVGDGELAEGQIWEAAMAASAHKLNNLICFLDFNGLQATGPTSERFPVGQLQDKWAAFGWAVQQIDGHDIQQIKDAIEAAKVGDKPQMIIARTVKGKGIPCAENVASFHNGAMNKQQYDETVLALGGTL